MTTELPALPDADERRRLVGLYLLAPDWTAAREAVEANAWLLSSDVDAVLEDVAEATSEQEDASTWGPLHETASQLLVECRSSAPVDVFSRHEDLDERFRHLAAAQKFDVATYVQNDASIYGPMAISALRILVLRAIVHRARNSEQLQALLTTLDRCQREGPAFLLRAAARQIDGALSALLPTQATEQTIALCERAIGFVEGDVDPPLRTSLQIMLGSHLLESVFGDRSANTLKARELYRDVREGASRKCQPIAWSAATMGIANALIYYPAATREDCEEAFSLFDEVLSEARGRGDENSLGSALLNYARALVNAPATDRVRRLEQALAHAQEAVDLFAQGRDSPAWNPLRWARALHNLGGMYLERGRGLRAQNVHLAVEAFREALTVRTIEADPVGRVRTLRALALAYPEWAAADSRDHAQQLAAEASAEANEIARTEPSMAARMTGWARFEGEISALNVDLDWVDALPPRAPVEWLEAAIAHHREALEVLSRAEMPYRWAEWKGGLGRLLGLLAREQPECLREAVACFDDALDVDALEDQPRLRADLYHRLTILGYEFGLWDLALHGGIGALEASDQLFAGSGGTEDRELELERSNRCAFIAAHAAARLGRFDDAVRCAENGRSRTFVDLAAAEEAALSSSSDTARAEVVEARERVRRLEKTLASVGGDGDTAQTKRMHLRLAEYLGLDPDHVQIRATRVTATDDDEQSEQYASVAAELESARTALRQSVMRARSGNEAPPSALGAEDVRAVAARAGYPIAYIVPSDYGSIALIVPPAGPPETVYLGGIKSTDTHRLLWGEEGAPGVLEAVRGNKTAIASAIAPCLEKLRQEVILPLSDWLDGRGYRRIALCPLGSFAPLPLHAAAVDDIVLSYVPSARVWSLALARLEQLADAPIRYFGVANPMTSQWPSLPFAAVETRSACRRYGHTSTTVVGAHATRSALESGLTSANVIHFACHGQFLSANPRDSALLLAGDDRIRLEELMSGELPLSGARVVLLSACQTAATETRRLINEAFGFPTALLLAGAAGVVGTLWPVVDVTTALFMERFHELHAAGFDAPSATAAAQRWLSSVTVREIRARTLAMRSSLEPSDGDAAAALSWLSDQFDADDPDSQPFTDPDYWAAFAYIGA